MEFKVFFSLVCWSSSLPYPLRILLCCFFGTNSVYDEKGSFQIFINHLLAHVAKLVPFPDFHYCLIHMAMRIMGRVDILRGTFYDNSPRGGHLFLAHKNDKKPANHNFSAFRAKIRPKKYPTTFFEEGGTYLADWKKRPNRPFIRCTSGMSRAFIFGKFFRCFSHFQFLVLGRGGENFRLHTRGGGKHFLLLIHCMLGVFSVVQNAFWVDTMYFRPFPELCNADFNDCNVPETPPVISNAGTPPEKIVAS